MPHPNLAFFAVRVGTFPRTTGTITLTISGVERAKSEACLHPLQGNRNLFDNLDIKSFQRSHPSRVVRKQPDSPQIQQALARMRLDKTSRPSERFYAHLLRGALVAVADNV